MGIGYYLGGHSWAAVLLQPEKGLWGWLRRQEQYCSCHGERSYFPRAACCSRFVQVQHWTPRQAEMLSTADRPHSSLWKEKGDWRWNVWRLPGSPQKLTAKGVWETGNFKELSLSSAWSWCRMRPWWQRWCSEFSSTDQPVEPEENHQITQHNLHHSHFLLASVRDTNGRTLLFLPQLKWRLALECGKRGSVTNVWTGFKTSTE